MAGTTWHRSLGVRLAFFLSVALIPIGLLAVMQTGDLVEQAKARDSAALLGRTRDAVSAEREVIQRAFGKAAGLAPVARMTVGDPATCARQLGRFIAAQETAVTAGFIGPDGTMWCSSRGGTFDFSEFPGWDDAVENPRSTVEINAEAPVSGQPVVVVSEPYYSNGTLDGFVFVSIPHEILPSTNDVPVEREFVVVTFTPDGSVLTYTTSEKDAADAVLPADIALSEIVTTTGNTFQAVARDGAMRSYATLPIVAGTVYALGSWVPVSAVNSAPVAIPPKFFPMVMFVTSLCVAFATIYRLVIRHISRLRREMRAFGQTRLMPQPEQNRDVSTEISELQEAFASMAETVLHDEAEMDQLLHDKVVLLKEVHHRVKNNLQLISSIMNMQVRQLKSPEAKRVVKRLQDRVLGLAAIHRNLYRTENLSQVHTASMLHELTDQIMAVGLSGKSAGRVEREFDDIALYPDQAMPLSLLIAEAVTNALKYLGGDAEIWLSMKLKASEDGTVLIEIANSRSETGDVLDEPEGTGLGSKLMRAFAMQLGGQIETEETPVHYTVRVNFTRQGFVPEEPDAVEAA